MSNHTQKAHASSWNQFEQFCVTKGYVLNQHTSVEQLSEILEDFACNMKKLNGSEYKEGVIKTQWNRIAKMLQKKFSNEYNIVFDPFRDELFQNARSARNTKRRLLQVLKIEINIRLFARAQNTPAN